MELDDFLEPEIAVAVAVTAAVATPGVRKVLRQGAVYGLAGILLAGDKISELAKSATEKAQQMMPETTAAGERASAATVPGPSAGEPLTT